MSKSGPLPTDEAPQVLIERIEKVNGDISCKHYSKGHLLGKGAFAKVYKLVCTETNECFAGKIISKAQLLKTRARQKLMSEIKIHRSLHYTNIVRFSSYFEDDDYLFLLMELCTNQTLSDLIRRRKRITELEAQCFLMQMISGLKYLHSHRVIHRDIKLGNVFIAENMEVKIGDFGLAAKLEYDGERKRTICGTPNYMAPEILDSKFGHSYECDIWSFGVVMYTLLVGKPPFETSDIKMTYRRIKLNLYNFPENIQVSEEARALISSILVVDYSKRPTFDEILMHEFFTRNIIPKLLPTCVLAVPPSSGYIKQFEHRGRLKSKEGSIVRASTMENGTTKSTPSPTSERPHSKDPEKPLYSETRGVPNFSAYIVQVPNGPDVWIKSWVDYSSKYGVGYLLSNNWIGVLFNDKTKVIGNVTGDTIKYIDLGHEEERVKIMSLNEFPKELYKKVMLLQLFKRQLGPKESVSGNNDQWYYLKNFIKTPHAILFRMSNKVIQVCFNDRSELLFSNMSKNVTYIDKFGVVSSYPLANVVETAGKDMVKRLKYSKEVLVKMFKSTKNLDV